MKWSHTLLECYCLFDAKKDKEIPNCCIKGIGHTGIHCLSFDEDEKKYCPFLGFTKAGATIALTNYEGDVVSYNSFQSDELDESSWFKKQKEWMRKFKSLIDKGVFIFM